MPPACVRDRGLRPPGGPPRRLADARAPQDRGGTRGRAGGRGPGRRAGARLDRRAPGRPAGREDRLAPLPVSVDLQPQGGFAQPHPDAHGGGPGRRTGPGAGHWTRSSTGVRRSGRISASPSSATPSAGPGHSTPTSTASRSMTAGPAGWFIAPWHGLRRGMRFEEFCRWLATPAGSDTFADRHWLSQHVQIRTRDGQEPDFVGRWETLDDDWRTVTVHIGMPHRALPRLNARPGAAPAVDHGGDTGSRGAVAPALRGGFPAVGIRAVTRRSRVRGAGTRTRKLPPRETVPPTGTPVRLLRGAVLAGVALVLLTAVRGDAGHLLPLYGRQGGVVARADRGRVRALGGAGAGGPHGAPAAFAAARHRGHRRGGRVPCRGRRGRLPAQPVVELRADAGRRRPPCTGSPSSRCWCRCCARRAHGAGCWP